ncbi:MAG TPA: RES family NAD+ phosphorylase [Terracidiphilus sp.]|jgi:RES domain-containing protein|nr:RES family NAD+ phosphorylase [Terracidiphilus sp.]
MLIWRLCRAMHAPGAFSGEGARRFGGRWNSRGVAMVYCSSSLALAAIELFVHLDPTQAPADLVAISALLPDGEPARTIEPADLPPEWWTDLTATRALGDAWIRASSSLTVRVPSVPIRPEWNVLLNPLHPRMAEFRIDAARPFVFDARMFQSGMD